MKLKTKYFVLLMLLVTLSIITIVKLNNNKNIKLDNVSLKESVSNSFALMLEQTNGTYEETTNTEWPSEGYSFNKHLSGCIDTNGNVIENTLSYENGTIKLKTKHNTYCYIYFDIDYKLSQLCNNGDNLGSCLTTNNEEIDSLGDASYAEMYRYTGTNDNVDDNYICFGTTDKDTCVNNPDTYMYRIVGVTSEDNATLGLEKNQLKLIKHISIGDHEWHSDYTTDTKWEYSTMYTYLQNDVLNNTTYYPSGWSNKIDSVKWNIGNTQTYTNGNAVYESECSFVTSNQSKLGLIYLSDYYYAYKTGGNENCVNVTCKNWLTDISNPIWTMNRYGYHPAYNDYRAWRIHYSGIVDNPNFVNIYSIRPVFYLNSEEIYVSGNGTLDNPIMLIEPEQTDAEYLIENVSSDVLWKSTLEDDGYRYIGTDPNNYVCFGYNNATTDCDFTSATNTDLYAYRIIGIFEDSEGTPHIKLIKKEALNTGYAWNSDYEIDIDWNESDLYNGINGNYFLTNTTYVPSEWSNKIVEWNYIATNTKTYENYNSTNRTPYGPHYFYNTVKTVYLHELNRGSKTSQTCYYDESTIADCSVGEWKYATDADWDKSEVPKVKISLMYASDYLLSLGSSALGYTSYTNNETLKTGWMHISNNDSGAPSSYEWTSSRFGDDGGGYFAWFVGSAGFVGDNGVVNDYSARPVFYLTSDVKISGEGTIGSPYIIS